MGISIGDMGNIYLINLNSEIHWGISTVVFFSEQIIWQIHFEIYNLGISFCALIVFLFFTMGMWQFREKYKFSSITISYFDVNKNAPRGSLFRRMIERCPSLG